MRSLFRAIIALAVVGSADAVYGIVQHFGPTGTGVCNWGGRISCDIVNKSVFSEIAGVPVAIIGLLGYLAIAGAALWAQKTQQKSGARNLFLLTASGFLFSAYLTYIEVWWLRAVCPICITSQTIIALLLLLTAVVYKNTKQHSGRQTNTSSEI